MSIRIEIPSYLRPFINEMEVVEVNANDVSECLDNLVKQFPGIKKVLFNQNGSLHDYVGIYINGEDAYPGELAKPVKDGDQLSILYIIAGG